MAVISSILTAIGTAAAAVGGALSTAGSAIGGALGATWGVLQAAGTAVGNFLGTTLFTIGGGTVTGGSMVGAGGALTSAAAGTVVGGTSITVGGVLAGVGLATTAAIGLASMYRSSRASAEAQRQQAEAIRKLQENQGIPEVSRVTNSLADNSRIGRKLNSLRISMLPQKQKNEDITQNVYGVDSNTVASSTQNMLGLNIATA